MLRKPNGPSRANATANASASAARRRLPARLRTVRSVSRQLQGLLADDRPAVVPGPRDPARAASAARLRYVCDEDGGIQRIRAGKGSPPRISGTRPPRGLDALEQATLRVLEAAAAPRSGR